MMPHSKPAVLPLCTAISLFATSALAQDSLPSPALEEMIVTASRVEKPIASIPNTVTVINKAELERQLSISHDLSTVLGNLVPGFSPSRQKLTNSGETLRGRSPLYLIDGVPQSNPLRDGSRDGVTIDPAMIERIEIIHGANAVHGMGASGGIINLITKKPTDALEQSVRADITTPTDDTDGNGLSGGLAYNFANRIGDWVLLFSVAHRETGVYLDADGRVIGVDGTQGDTMDSESQDIFFKGGYRGDGYSLHLIVNDFTLEGNGDWVAEAGDNEGDPTISVPGEVPGTASTNDVQTVSLDYRADQLLGHSVTLKSFHVSIANTPTNR